MAIDFPASPTNGQTFVVGTVTYTWDGVKWTALASGGGGGGGGGSGDKIEEGNTSAEVIDTGSDGRFVVTTEGTERLRVDSSGALLLGTSTSVGANPARLQIKGAAGGVAPFAAYALISGNDEDAGGISASDSASNSITVRADPYNLRPSSDISFAVDGTERLWIKSNGSFFFNSGGSVPSASNPGSAYGWGGQSYWANAVPTTGVEYHWAFLNTNGEVGKITTSGTSTSFTTSSDYRLKENVTLLTGATDRLKQIPVHQFNFIADPDTTVDGFIAHEAQAVVPECVTGTKDAVDADGNPIYQGIDQSKLVPLLTAALQEAIGEIESLKARVAALETP